MTLVFANSLNRNYVPMQTDNALIDNLYCIYLFTTLSISRKAIIHI